MKNSIIYAAGLIGAVTARPGVNKYSLAKREVPQEQSHRNVNLIVQESLQLDNPDNIQDPVFGLLGAAAAAEGAGNIADTDCLQQAAADQAFTNAKAAGDVNGMTFALIYRALEKNTGSVGLASEPCLSIQAVNPEIAALQQHQDPASDGAAELNKQIATELAIQIASIGGDPLLANEASTFAPGEIGDPTGAGNTCDTEDDDNGCINTLGLRVDDLSEDEILAAVGGAGAAAGNANNATAGAAAGAGKKAKGAANKAAAACDARRVRRHARRQAADFGSCTNPSIVFGPPSDGRQEDAFEAADLTSFPHGSALGIGIISGFICDQLVNACDANQAAVTLCDQADAATGGLTGQAAADAFNSVLGF